MLVLTRKADEAVMVGGCTGFEHLLKVTVLEIDGGKVRLGFEVNVAVPVHRWEVWERIHAHDQVTGAAGNTVVPAIPRVRDGITAAPQITPPEE